MELFKTILELCWVFVRSVLSSPSLVFLLIFCILLKIYYPKIRGFMGEFWVKVELSKLSKEEYIVLNDVMIESNNKTHQIDHIILSKYGIFVIEMKNYCGLITGSEYKDKWCQHLGKNKSYFLNPLHQNYGHMKVLSDVLNLDEKFFISIVCFSNQAKLKVDSKSCVTYLDYLVNEIRKYDREMVKEDIEEIKNKLINLNIVDKQRRKSHVKDIRTKIKMDIDKSNNMICPKCGGQLMKRNGKYGLFIGCSNYPKCKFIRK